MRRLPSRRPTGSIPVSSMADIAFLLLVFFLVTTVFPRDQGLALVLPAKDTTVPVSATNLLQFVVRADGFVEVRRGEGEQVQLVRPADLRAVWRQEFAENARLIALIETDGHASYERMIEVLDALKAAGAERISLRMVAR
ncbi:MAG: biopolymer transporter ExbD [Gemmatimonadota bacterium]